MKCFLAFLLLLTATGKAQSIALLHLSFQKPVTYTDSVSLETFTGGVFPVYLQDAKCVVKTIEQLSKTLNRRRSDYGEINKIRIGRSALTLRIQTYGHGKKYVITLSTESNGFTAYLELVKGKYDRAVQKRIFTFLDYLRNNIPVADDALP